MNAPSTFVLFRFLVRCLAAVGLLLPALLLAQAAVITSIPAQRLVVNPGQALTLSATATGATTYQWRRNGKPITGATNATYAVTTASRVDAGWYQFVATNASGSSTSAAVFRLVAPASTQVVGWGGGAASPPSGLNNAVAIAAAAQTSYSVALRADGSVVEWGSFYAVPSGLANVVAVAAGDSHTLALKSDGTVVAWGDNTQGQTTVPSGLVNVVGVAAGARHSVALKDDGTVVTWGQYHNGSNNFISVAVPTGLTGVVAVAAGDHSLALKSDGTLVEWGSTWARTTTVPTGTADIAAIAVGSWNTVAAKADGTVAVWGVNSFGSLGVPSGLSNVIAVSAGQYFSLALKSDGTVVGWGWNDQGQTTLPAGLTNVLAIASGGSHSVALTGPLQITTQPSDVTSSLGGTAQFTIAAAGSGLVHQWYRNGTLIPGATSATLNLTALTVADGGTYQAAVSNSSSTIRSAVATLRGSAAAPTLTVPPVAVAATAGQPATLSVTATGSGTLSYQWRRGGYALPGATTAAYQILSTTRADADLYDVIVSSGLSATVSPSARLTVAPVAYPGFVGFDPASTYFLEDSTSGNLDTVLPLPEGRFLLGGSFATLGGQRRPYLARFLADGTVDSTFTPPAFNSTVRGLARQADGKILVVGFFSALSPQTSYGVARLHADGTLDPSFNPGQGIDTMHVQADGKILVAGSFTTLFGQPRDRIARLHSDGTLDTTFLPVSINSSVNRLAAQPDGKVVIAGFFSTVGGQTRSNLARLNADGTLDAAFAPNPNSSLASLTVQADGKILVAGFFSVIAGQSRSSFARLNADGTLETAFNPAPNSSVNTVAIEPGGTILVGGSFGTIGGQTRTRLARLGANGVADPAFNVSINSSVNTVALTTDGRLILLGSFTTVAGEPRDRLARLSSSGALDAAPAVSIRGLGQAATLAPAPGGKLYVGGRFTHVNGVAVPTNLLRLSSDGTVDPSFAPPTPSSSVSALTLQGDGSLLVGGSFFSMGTVNTGAVARLTPAGALDAAYLPLVSGQINCLTLQPDGSLLVGGSFSSVASVTRSGVARLAADGRLDRSFAPVLANSSGGSPQVSAIAVLPDGRIVIGGTYTSVNGTARTHLARLAVDGALDPTFAPALAEAYYMRALHLQADGRLVIAGNFYNVSSTSRQNVARLLADGALDPSFGSTSGFQNGINAFLPQEDGRLLFGGYFESHAGSPGTARVARLTAAGASDAAFRFATGAAFFNPPQALHLSDSGQLWVGGSETGGFGLARLAPGSAPVIGAAPASQVSSAGATVTFSVTATGAPAPSYQWNFNGSALPGATAASLVLTNVQPAQAGAYTVTVANGFGSVTSPAATLSGAAAAPVIVTPPAATVAATAGQPVTLSVSATGAAPLTYQWRRNGYFLPGASAASYTIPSASRTDTDLYDVIVYAGLTPAVSSAARLTVAPAAFPAVVAMDASKPALFESANGQILRLWPLADGRTYAAGRFVNANDTPRTGLVRLLANGTLDPTFASLGFPDPYSQIRDLIVLSDGKLLVAGSFYTIAGQNRSNLTRLNTDGTVDTTYATRGFSGEVYALAPAPDGRLVVVGYLNGYYDNTNNYVPRAGGVARLNADGTLDTPFNPASSGLIRAVSVQADGKVIVGGEFSSIAGQSRSYLARLNADGTYDATHATGTGPSSRVTALALQADGKLIVGGWFNSFNGTAAGRIVRLESTGAVDTAYATAAGAGFNSDINSLTLAPDGKLLAAGYFGAYNNNSRNGIARILTTGALDTTFNSTVIYSVNAAAIASDGTVFASGNISTGSTSFATVARLSTTGVRDAAFAPTFRAEGYPRVALALPGGKTLVGGDFTHVNGVRLSCPNLVRFHPDGAVDSTFAPGSGPSSGVSALLLEPDGGVIVGGYFYSFNGLTKSNLVRLTPDGTLDPAYPASAPNSSVYALARSPGGQVVMGGFFSSVGGVARSRVARLHPDGTLDASFDPGTGPSDSVQALLVAPDRKVYIGGYFSTVAGQPRPYVARLHADGTLDPGFADPGLNSTPSSFVLQPDGKLLLGSYSFNNVPGLLRLLPDGTRDPAFTLPTIRSVSAIILQEDGRILASGYEDYSSSTYLSRYLADGTRDPAFGATGLRSNIYSLLLRDNGQLFAVGGYTLGGTTTIPGTLFGPSVLTQPQSQVATLGGTVTFSVTANGNPAPTYLWRRNGITITGATTATLTLTNVQSANAGTYHVSVSNSQGSLSSRGVTLTFDTDPVAPTITTPPQNVSAVAGTTASFTVVASGTPAPTYQWKKGTTTLTGATSATLTFSPVSTADAGSYTVTASNSSGSVTSGSVTLTVTVPLPEALAAGSVRAPVGTAAAPVLVGAFTVEGTLPKQMLVRAVGPGLAAFGVSGTLADPFLEVVNAQTGASVATNNDWGAAANSSQVVTATTQVGAFALSASSKDAVVLATFAPGTYRTLVTGPAGASGVVFLEVYEADTAPRLVYLATRAHVGTGAAALTQGFVISPIASGRTYLVRALGPTLGLPGALADPALTLFSGSTAIATNDNWGGDASVASAALTAGAMPLPPTSADAALVFTPSAAGSFTAQVTGVGGTTGVALIEICEVDGQRAASFAPAIVSAPATQVLTAGQSATFGVVTTAKPAPTFQWRKAGIPLDGATASTLVIAAAQATNHGRYDVVVTNPSGTTTTAPTTLFVGGLHSADHSPADGALNLFELTRVIELYNVRNGTVRTGAYAVATTATEDGFATDPARLSSTAATLARYHSGDTNADARISLIELTRMIELFNTRTGTTRTGAYRVATTTSEDGFAPAP